ncbi:hypothetical protein PoB_001364200 [Plakobranchus ocellatus]|uniref:Uncharacterized protein n=1 Tax=Plakobranchus ocellatus TaxID=259542 RepID=A0AAV3YVZ4_9GAST|nr:hypothetical protein PoB_001364200 [Plakobranchus ocellatus]
MGGRSSGGLKLDGRAKIMFVSSESAMRSAGTILSRVRAPQPAPWPDGAPESLRSPCCGLAIYKNQICSSTIRLAVSSTLNNDREL